MKFSNPFSQGNLSTKQNHNSSELNLPINQTKSLTKQISIWRFILPLTLQLGLILSVPAQAIYTVLTGTRVVLQTAPVDPYDFLRGYYQVLSYDISRKDNLNKLPGWNQFELETNASFGGENNNDIYVILAVPETRENLDISKVGKPVGVSAKYPENLPDNQIAIKGEFDVWGIKYGLETYYMPEDRREEINHNIRQIQGTLNSDGEIPFVVEVKINNQGKAVPLSLWVGEHNYKF
ncbi:MAG: GDYXXLXY domain-containing protein [Microcoleaceae cyanobacterium MO_207.B10]|nr:GDYXXLXY domain-containing protein [Microcoleaceae cyanobacterium MO_207.B10]